MGNIKSSFNPFLCKANVLVQYCIVCMFISISTCMAQVISIADKDKADELALKYKGDNVACLSSSHYYTFDKGKNALGDNVVVIQEDAEMEFISLKQFATLTYPEFYNKFIQLKTFKKAEKRGAKYFTSSKVGYDRSVTDDDIFFDDSRVQYHPLYFYQKGAMAKVTVKKEFSDGKYLSTLYFNRSYPIAEQVFEFKVPSWLVVDFIPINFEEYKIEKTTNKKGDYTNYRFVMKDLPAIKKEFSSLGIAYTDPHIIVQIKSFKNKNEELKGFDKVDDVYAWNNRLYGMADNKPEQLKPILEKIVQGKNTDIEKIKAIYYWVQDNIRYIAYEDGYSGYIPASVQDVLAKKYGDCKGMANMLTELLKLAGFDAHFTWIGTQRIPYSQSIPALCVNNHAITTLYLNGKEYFLDATEEYQPFGENAFRLQGKEALISKKDDFEIKKVPFTTEEKHSIKTHTDFVLAGEKLSGNAKLILDGNQRTGFHQSYHRLPLTSQEDFLNELLEFGNENIHATNVKISDVSNREIPITIEGKIDLSNSISSISANKYVSIDFFPKTLESFMPDEKRVRGYDMGDRVVYDDEISLTIPADKRFDDIPEKVDLNYAGYSFTGSYSVIGNKLILKKTLSIKNNIIKPEEFDNWKTFLNSIKDFTKYLITVSPK